MKHIGLFEGIGGFSLAARWMGWETVAWCEWNEFGQKVLRHHFPGSEGFGDITKSDFTKYANTVDIVTGGFPCQPYSAAGKRLGKEDDRHLWPEMLRAIREIQPRWVVGENVAGLLNWNGGVVLDEIKSDLENSGFEVFPPCILPACAVNANHRRDRVWIIAFNANCSTSKQKENFGKQNGSSISSAKQKRVFQQAHDKFNGLHNVSPKERVSTNAELWGRKKQGGQATSRISNNHFQTGWPQSEPTLCRGDDGLSDWVDRIKALGNAIVPQVSLQIFKAIEQYELNQTP